MSKKTFNFFFRGGPKTKMADENNLGLDLDRIVVSVLPDVHAWLTKQLEMVRSEQFRANPTGFMIITSTAQLEAIVMSIKDENTLDVIMTFDEFETIMELSTCAPPSLVAFVRAACQRANWEPRAVDKMIAFAEAFIARQKEIAHPNDPPPMSYNEMVTFMDRALRVVVSCATKYQPDNMPKNARGERKSLTDVLVD